VVGSSGRSAIGSGSANGSGGNETHNSFALPVLQASYIVFHSSLWGFGLLICESHHIARDAYVVRHVVNHDLTLLVVPRHENQFVPAHAVAKPKWAAGRRLGIRDYSLDPLLRRTDMCSGIPYTALFLVNLASSNHFETHRSAHASTASTLRGKRRAVQLGSESRRREAHMYQYITERNTFPSAPARYKSLDMRGIWAAPMHPPSTGRTTPVHHAPARLVR
jgi:hypothetical protein